MDIALNLNERKIAPNIRVEIVELCGNSLYFAGYVGKFSSRLICCWAFIKSLNCYYGRRYDPLCAIKNGSPVHFWDA